MKVSLNWIRSINDRYHCASDPAPDGIDKLVEKIGSQLGAVEEVINLGERYKGIVVVKIVACKKHQDADKLTVCTVDDGGVVKDVNRSGQGYVEVVCGAPNVRAGMLAVWIPPGATVPSTMAKDPLVVDARDIRGVISHGMLASPKELALSDDHEGLLEIDEEAAPGTLLAKLYELDDYIVDIENKMFTHRPDLFGMLGIARELAGIQQHVFKSPDWYSADAKLMPGNNRDTHPLTIKNEVPKLVPRFMAVVMKDVKVKPSPLWLQTKLSRVGVRPVNNIVDLTNFHMLTTAQPLHAYDYEKVRTLSGDKHPSLIVRMSKDSEKLKLLGGKEISLNTAAVVIATRAKAIGLGGVIGGVDTEVDENSKNIIFECASFDMNTTRRTAMAYGLFTEAATRFTKDQSPLQNSAVLTKLVEDAKRIAGGRPVGEMYDDNHIRRDVLERGSVYPPVVLQTDFINQRLGLELPTKKILDLLSNVEFKVQHKGGQLEISAPFWRTDIEIAEDIVEEVGRLYGYDKLPLSLPSRDLVPASVEPLLAFKAYLREILTMTGGNEVLTYSFVDGRLLEQADQDKAKAHHIRNALSPDLQYYRLSLVPSLLASVHANIKAGFERFALYELGKTHQKGINDKESLPAEMERLGIVVAQNQTLKQAGSSFFGAKYLITYLLNKLNIDKVTFKLLTEVNNLPERWQQTVASFAPEHSAVILSDDKVLGIVGEPTAKLHSALKLPSRCSQVELDIQVLQSLAKPPKYKPLNRYPSTHQDLCLRVKTDISYGQLTEALEQHLEEAAAKQGYDYTLYPLDIFRRPGEHDHRQITWRITLAHPQRTLTTKEVNHLLDGLAAKAKQELKAERV